MPRLMAQITICDHFQTIVLKILKKKNVNVIFVIIFTLKTTNVKIKIIQQKEKKRLLTLIVSEIDVC